MSEKETCPYCSGTGKIYIMLFPHPCYACKGRGSVDKVSDIVDYGRRLSESVIPELQELCDQEVKQQFVNIFREAAKDNPCPTCNGTGQAEFEGEWGSCWDCEGVGFKWWDDDEETE